MPLGVPLSELRRDLRAETGQSPNLSQGVQAQANTDIMIDRQQRELWDAYYWPHLAFHVDVALNAGQSIYNYPEAMPFDQINRILVSDGAGSWKELSYGIRAFDIPVGGPTQSWPPKQWGNKVSVTGGKTNPVGQIQLLPTPNQSGVMRLDGQAPINPLVNDDDVCVIDSKAIVLFTAAEMLATNKSEAAPLKLTKAQNYLRRLLQNSGADKRANYNMGGSRTVNYFSARPFAGWVPGIDYIP